MIVQNCIVKINNNPGPVGGLAVQFINLDQVPSKNQFVTPNSQRYLSRRGMTLVEIMVASTILAVVLISVLAISSQSFRYIADMRRSARSAQVLQQRVEDIRLYTNWPNILALHNSQFTNTTVDIFGTITNQWIGTVTVGSFSPYSTAEVVSVTVAVTWRDRLGRNLRTNSLSTLISNGGLDKYIF